MRRSPIARLLLVLHMFLLLALGMACGSSPATEEETVRDFSVESSAVTLKSIAVTPATSSLYASVTQQLTATGTYSSGPTQNLTNTATWTSSNTAIATVNATGLVTTVAPGTATITAQSGTRKGKATIKVLVTLTSIAITPGATSIPANTTQALVATGSYDNKTTKNLTSTVTWTSSNSAVATVSSAGFVVAVAPGVATITASTNASSSTTIVGTTTLTVDSATIKSIAVTPASKKLADGASQTYTATALFSDGTKHVLVAPVVTWASSSNAIATVTTAGVATGKGIGTDTITAKHVASGLSGTAKLTITSATLVSVAVSPATSTILVGLTQQYAATGTYSDGSTNDVTAAVTWSSSAVSVATINSSGLAAAIAAGTDTITATDPKTGKNGTAVLTVTPAQLASIAISPIPAIFPAGTHAQATATGTLTNGTTENITSMVTWSSSSPSVATVSNASGSQGLVSALARGTTTLSAVDPTTGISQQETVTISAAYLTSITVSPATSIPLGTTVQLTARAAYSDGSTADVTQTSTWTASNGDVFVSNAPGTAGQVTASILGNATITATDPATGISGQTMVTATSAVLQSIQVSPATANLAYGASQAFTATGAYSDGSLQNMTAAVTWSSNTGVISVSNAAGTNGLATATGYGTAALTATDPTTAISGSAQITVTAPALVAISVSPPATILWVGQTQSLLTFGTYSDGSTAPIAPGWSTSTAAVSITGGTGTSTNFTGVAPGTLTVTATDSTSGVSSAPVAVTVTPALFDESSASYLGDPNGGPAGTVIGDFNRDGIPDIATCDPTTIWLGTGGGEFSAPTTYPSPNAGRVLVAADLNGDGILDLAVTTLTNSIGVRLGAGDGTFSAETTYAAGALPWSLVAHDMNQDGILDLVAGNYTDGTVSIFIGTGTGAFLPQTVIAVANTVTGVAAADFNGDGLQDVAVTSVGAGLTIFPGLGGGSFGAGTSEQVSTFSAEAIVAADFNSDGISDLAVGDDWGTVTVLLGTGAGGFAPSTAYPTAALSMRTLVVADLNNDGLLDLAGSGFAASTIGVLLEVSPGQFGAANSVSFSNYPSFYFAAGDVTGDGLTDLVLADLTSSNIAIFPNLSTAPYAGNRLCTPTPAGLVSSWSGNGNAVDSTGLNSGTAFGAGVTYIPGVVGQGFHFDGASYITSTATNLPTGSADRTIELWGRLDTSYPSSDAQGLFFGYGTWGEFTGTNEMLVLNGTAPNQAVFSQWGYGFLDPTPLTIGNWFHYAYTLAGGLSTLYINGTSVAVTTSMSVNTPSGTSAFIGGNPNPTQGTEWLLGGVDEIAVYSRALSASEIQGIYLAGSAGKCP